MSYASNNFHSRFVGWAKVALPLIAIGLLSTLFLFARTQTEPTEIPFSTINQLARDQRISNPQFSGVAGDGSVLRVTAQSAQPKDGELDFLVVTAPRLDLTAIDGTTLRIEAGEGSIDGPGRMANLVALARLETSSGFLMETEGLTADFKTGTIVSHGPLEIHAPFGEIIAGHVQIIVEDRDAGQQMHFTEGVKMLYTPVQATSLE